MNIFLKVDLNTATEKVINKFSDLGFSFDENKAKSLIDTYMKLSKEWYPENTHLFIILEQYVGLEDPNAGINTDVDWERPEGFNWLVSNGAIFVGELA